MKIKIESEGRLDQVLSLQLNKTRSQISLILENNPCLLNGKQVLKNGMKVKPGDTVEIEIKEVSHEFKKLDIPIDIVYEDEYLMVINKPRGLVVNPGSGHENDTLVNMLANYFDKSENDFYSDFRMGIVHRIDKDTSGLLVVGKTLDIKEKLSKLIEKHEVSREYLAIASGFFSDRNFKVDASIARDKINRQKMAVSGDGKNAISHFKVIHQFNNCALLLCKLETGRTHQIRVHLSYINHPILGDTIYNRKKSPDFINKGQLLHAFKLSFVHPIYNKTMTFYSDLDEYFISCMVKLAML